MFFKKLLLSSLTICFVSACQKSTHEQTKQESLVSAVTYGDIERYDILQTNTTDKPEQNFVARLTNPRGETCSAALVGKNLAITSAHCVTTDSLTKKLIPGTSYIELAFNRGLRLDISNVTKIHPGPSKTPKTLGAYAADWAILELDRPLGETFGYFELSPIVGNISFLGISIIGYSSHFNRGGSYQTYQEKCLVRRSEEIFIYHDCDIRVGDSGAPLYYCNEFTDSEGEAKKACFLVAVQTAYLGSEEEGLKEHLDLYSHEYANVAFRVESFREKLEELKGGEH
ncbi:trypsin-like serine protease [bacterium]|nr:trypsin-like serine protease [bacterium]